MTLLYEAGKRNILFKRKSYTWRFVSIFILLGLCLTFFIVTIFYYEERRYQQLLLDERFESYLVNKKNSFHNFYSRYEKFLRAVLDNPIFNDYISAPTPENRETVMNLFRLLAEHEEEVTQLRYIRSDGQEIIRVDRPQQLSDVSVVLGEDLQNKASRYYFNRSMKLPSRGVYVSRLDLNVEHGVVEVPYKPVLRVAMPVFRGDSREGIIIVNVFAEPLLDDMVNSETLNVFIYDLYRYVLVTNVPGMKNWTRYQDMESNLDPKLVTREDTLIDNMYGQSLFIGVSSRKHMLGFQEALQGFSIVLILLVPLAWITAYIIAKIPERLFDRIEIQNRMLFQQSKQAAMMELISSIAHHWRQPLNEISLSVQMMHSISKGAEYDDIDVNYLYKLHTEKVDYLSRTIDNFRDYFSIKKEKVVFNLVKEIFETAMLMQAQLIATNTDLRIQCSCRKNKLICGLQHLDSYCGKGNDYIYGHQAEFRHVILNVLGNAKDAIDEKRKSGWTSGKIYLDISVDDSEFVLKVFNSGDQIHEDIIENLFDPYFTTKEEGAGVGLGLYMSKLIIENEFKGTISINNNEEGVDCIIRIPRYLGDKEE